MNNERLEELKARAKRADELAEKIRKLTDADPYRSRVSVCFQDRDSGKDCMPDDLLKKVIAEGCLKVLGDMEHELESLFLPTSTDIQEATS